MPKINVIIMDCYRYRMCGTRFWVLFFLVFSNWL